MNHDLTDADIDAVLQSQLYGHLGCTLPDGQVYVVPITYAYHEGALYSFSYSGLKIDALRSHADACVQTEEFQHDGDVRSVIVWGTYEELSGTERLQANTVLTERLESAVGIPRSPLYQVPTGALLSAFSRISNMPESIFFRINIQRKTGKHFQYD